MGDSVHTTINTLNTDLDVKQAISGWVENLWFIGPTEQIGRQWVLHLDAGVDATDVVIALQSVQLQSDIDVSAIISHRVHRYTRSCISIIIIIVIIRELLCADTQIGQKLAYFSYALTSSNVNRFLQFFHFQNQTKIFVITIITLLLNIQTHLKCVATLPCVL